MVPQEIQQAFRLAAPGTQVDVGKENGTDPFDVLAQECPRRFGSRMQASGKDRGDTHRLVPEANGGMFRPYDTPQLSRFQGIAAANDGFSTTPLDLPRCFAIVA
ncbi:hypothetical protein DLREEDagrD3_03220 [Denitratisoma sp. agr-D3]